MRMKRTFRRLMSVLCCLAMLMAWLPVMPAAAAESKTVLSEDFESYAVGQDSFYDANPDKYTYFTSYHGSPSDASYATYGIVKERNDQILRLSAHNTKANWFTTRDKVVGPYTLTLDVRVHTPQADKATPSFIINPFQDNTFGSGKVGLLYFDPLYGTRFTDAITTGSSVNIYMKAAGTTFKPEYDTWYTLKLAAEEGKLTVKAWERGASENTAAELVWQSDLLTQAVLNKGSKIRVQNMSRNIEGAATVTDVDNIVLQSGTTTPAAPKPVTPAPVVSADLGKNSWVVFRDTFENYPVGEDSFYEANKDLYSFVASYHGSPSDESYSTYGIVNANGGKALKLSSYNAKANWFLTRETITGAYTLSFDVNMGSPKGTKTPSLCFNLFQGNAFGSGKVSLFYVDPMYGARYTDATTTGSNVNIYMKNAAGATFKPAYDTWYTMQAKVEPGKITFNLWPKDGDQADGGELVWQSDLLTAAVLENPSAVRINNVARNEAGIATSMLIDNLTVTKPYDTMNVPAVVFGLPGEELVSAVSFTGQDLAKQMPAPAYKYTLGDAQMGTAKDGKLLLGTKQGQTTMTMELLDLMGNPTGVKATTKLVVGTSYGIKPDAESVRVAESAIGTTQKIGLAYESAVKSTYPAGTESWSSSDESVVKVSAGGVLTFTGFGSAVVTVKIVNGGKDTEYFANIPVQVGAKPIRVLFIGGSFSRDTSMYMSDLARVLGYRVEAAYLQKSSGTLRNHARNLAQARAEYSYWKSNPLSGDMVWLRTTTIQDALGDGTWDIVVLQQNSLQAGMTHSFNSDLEYIIDYVKAEQPKAKLFWNLTWAYEKGLVAGTHGTNFRNYYNGDENTMYNAIVRTFDEKIWGADAMYPEFDGWIPAGVAVQNLRETYGPVTRDGFHLSVSVGRLTAALAALKAIIPEADLSRITAASVADFIDLDQYDEGIKDDDTLKYENTEANMAKVRAAVQAATADLTRAPALRAQPKQTRVEDVTKQDDITVAQVNAPMKLHFPDIIVLKDGTAIVGAYENVYHYPDNNTGSDSYGIEGAGRLVVWASYDNGKTWNYDKPLLVVDEPNLEKWGIAKTSDRYARLQANPGEDYIFLADPRDPNFGLVYTDITGDGKEDEVLLFTFWMRNYAEGGQKYSTHMMWSIDGGKTWSDPQSLEYKTLSVGLKRGDIAAFANGEILVPVYLSNHAYCLRMAWDMGAKKWKLLAETEVPNVTKESSTFNEVSFVVPDPDSNTAFVFCRENGTVLRSDDRGATWTVIADEPGLIHQPGFALIDEDRVFATWARTFSPRTVYGKMFYVNGGWDATPTQTVYASPHTTNHDMADPSSKLMANGKILAVCYDTAYRSIVGTWVDPNGEGNVITELSAGSASTIQEQTFADGKSGSVSFNAVLPESYTVYAEVEFTAGGKVEVAVPGGAPVTFKAGENGVEAGKTYTIRVSVVGSSTYSRIWEKGTAEPAGFVAGKNTSSGTKLAVTASGAKIFLAKVTQRVSIKLQETVRGFAGTTAQPECQIMPALPGQWSSSDPAVVKVDSTGKLTLVSVGTATVTVNVNGATASCKVSVDPQPAELVGRGERKVIFRDDFQGYTAGTNAFWNQMEGKGYASNGTAAVEGKSTYDIVTENGNTYLKLGSSGAKATWHKVNTPIVGNYTVQFDFFFTDPGPGQDKLGAPGQYLYITPFQDSGVHGFVHLAPEGIRTQYKAAGAEATTNYPQYFAGETVYALNQWHTVKITRVDGGLYAKVWKQGAQEPAQWDVVLQDDSLDTDPAAYFRIQFYMSGANKMQYAGIDNLIVTQQQGKGAEFMNDVKSNDWFYDAVDYAIKNGIMSGYNATTFGPNDTLSRAMVVQVLYNKEGQPALNGEKHSFPDVPADQWFNNAVTWGSKRGVVSGFGDGKFRPNDYVTIEQVAVILHNYSGKPAAAGEPAGVGKYDDWAKQALSWAVAQGIMKNVPFTNATENATRAQTAQMLMNFLSK